MDLVTCPSCQFTFSPTPGKAVKCPACMTLIAPASGKPAPKAAPRTLLPERAGRPTPKPRRNRDDFDEDEPTSRGTGLLIAAAAVGLIVLLGGGILIARSLLTAGPSGLPAPPVVAQVAPQVIPEVVIPKTAPPAVDPNPNPDPVDPKLDPFDAKNDPKIDLKIDPKGETSDPPPKKNPPKIRPLDPSDPPKIDPPIKVTKKVVREVDGVTPERIDDAIKRGVGYLGVTSAQWVRHDKHPLGYAALGGLTMLECKTPPNHPAIAQAAEVVRRLAPGNEKTYEVSLAILFLDRLGDARDRGLIQTLGARLVAGQQAGGSYTYILGPPLTPAETTQLLTFLRSTRPSIAAMPVGVSVEDKLPEKSVEKIPEKSPPDAFDPFAGAGKIVDPLEPRPEKPMPAAEDGALVSMPPKVLPKSRLNADVGTVRLPAGGGVITNPSNLSARLQRVPAVVNQGREKDQMILNLTDGSGSDHSNLQFAVVALWAARRHGVVTDRALLLAEARMRKVQRNDGGWNYENDSYTTPSMACSGLLALGLGNAAHQSHPEGLAATFRKDTHMTQGLDRLSYFLEQPYPKFENANTNVSSYFLWSVERVAVMLNVQTIGGKDWYGWGAQSVLKRQEPRGSWPGGGFPESTNHVDTCFSLLFLVRSNLVSEVTEQIRLQMPLGDER